MSKRLRIILLCIFALVAALCTLAACAGSRPSNYQDAKEKGYNSTVTYYAKSYNDGTANIGGNFKGNTSLVSVKLRYKSGVTPMEITEDSTKYELFLKTQEDKVFDAWYYIELDESGSPKFVDSNGNAVKEAKAKDGGGEVQYILATADENSEDVTYINQLSVYPVLTENKVDFKNLKLTANTDIYIAANWQEDIKVIFKLAPDSAAITVTESTTAEDGTVENKDVVYTPSAEGTVITKKSYDRTTKAVTISKSPVTLSTSDTANKATYVKCYYDAACTKMVTSSIYRADSGKEVSEYLEKEIVNGKETGNVIVYVKYLEGEWTILETAKDIKNMFGVSHPTASSENKYYLLNDINCTGTTIYYTNTAYNKTFGCTFVGNGYTISNLTFGLSSLGQGTVSAFGEITSDAKITDVTFENLTMSFSAKTNATIYAITTGVDQGATISNFKIDGLTVTMEAGGTITASKDNFMFGGYKTDAAFLAANTGITVSGETSLTIDDATTRQETTDEETSST